jgi:hypothetical protein
MSDLEWLIAKLTLLAQDWKTIVLGTLLLTSASTLAYFLVAQSTYSTRMVAPLSPEVRALISAGVIGNGALAVSPELAAGSQLFIVTLSDTTPERAEANMQEALSQIVTASKPSRGTMQRILAEIDAENRAIAELRSFSPAAAISASITKREANIAMLQSRLEGITREDIPALPGKPSKQPWSIRALLVAFGASLFVMGMTVLARPALTAIWLRSRRPKRA